MTKKQRRLYEQADNEQKSKKELVHKLKEKRKIIANKKK